jgi:hypothetical protein
MRILKQQQEGGVIFPQQVENDLLYLASVLDNLILVNQGKKPIPLPGGASGAIARHFPNK